jgi:hypothetical protein
MYPRYRRYIIIATITGKVKRPHGWQKNGVRREGHTPFSIYHKRIIV